MELPALGAIEECGADVVIAGTRGRGALGRATLGSTAADLLRESPVPLMVVPPSHPEVVSLGVTRAQAHVGIILAAVDMTARSERQIAWAAGLTPASDHRLLLLHVVGDEAGRARALERMNAAVRGVETARGFRLLVRVGAPAREVLHVTGREKGVGVVVVGRSAETPGKLAYEVLRQDRALVAMVP